MKTSELEGALLNYWVARAEGVSAAELYFYRTPYSDETVCARKIEGVMLTPTGPCRHDVALHYSTQWAEGGPLIDKYCIELRLWPKAGWTVRSLMGVGQGNNLAKTPLEAICRAVVRAAFGDEVGEVGNV